MSCEQVVRLRSAAPTLSNAEGRRGPGPRTEDGGPRTMNRREWGRVIASGVAASALAPLARASAGADAVAAGADAPNAQQSADAPRTYRYIHLDVFTDRRLAGNQLAVFPDPAGLDVQTMHA